MANIFNNQVVPLTTITYGGIDPYSPCVQWYGYTGGATANAFPIFSGSGTAPSTNTPYIISANIGCSSGTGVGVFSGTFVANGYTGLIAMWVNTTDGIGCVARSNTLTFSSIAASTGSTGSPLTAYAGVDRSTTANTLTQTGATATGGTPPYTPVWTAIDYPGGAPSITNDGTFTPTFEGLNAPGDYEFNLQVTDDNSVVDNDRVFIYKEGTFYITSLYGTITMISPSFYTITDGSLPVGPDASAMGYHDALVSTSITVSFIGCTHIGIKINNILTYSWVVTSGSSHTFTGVSFTATDKVEIIAY